MDPDIEMDLRFILRRNLKDITKKYAFYVDCLRTVLEEKGVTAEALHSYLLSVSAFSSSCSGHRLALVSDNKHELEKAETVRDIFDFLTTECASFLNCEIFQDIMEKYNINEDRKELKYHEHLKAYIKKHTVSEFVKINPLLKPKKGCKKLTLKYDIDSTCKLAKVQELKNCIAEILELNPSALHIIDIEDGCVLVTFAIPASVADIIFTPDTVFTSQQENALRDASVQWLECNGNTFHFNLKEIHAESPGMYVAKL